MKYTYLKWFNIGNGKVSLIDVTLFEGILMFIRDNNLVREDFNKQIKELPDWKHFDSYINEAHAELEREKPDIPDIIRTESAYLDHRWDAL